MEATTLIDYLYNIVIGVIIGIVLVKNSRWFFYGFTAMLGFFFLKRK